jgi:hypothetical protein
LLAEVLLLVVGNVLRAEPAVDSAEQTPAAADNSGTQSATQPAGVKPSKPAPSGSSSGDDELSIEQARLADRFERLETVLGRLAELSASSDPKRAKLLREAVAKSREQDLQHRFETIVSLLENERLAAAANKQTDLQNELDGLLTMLLKADRDQQVDTEYKRIKKYLQDVERLIRLQKDVKARTEGGDDTHRLAKDQQDVAGKTGKSGDAIGESERHDAKSAKDAGKPAGDEKSEAGESKDGKSKDGSSKDGSPKDGGKPGDASKPPADGAPSGTPPSDSKGDPSSEPGQPGGSPPSPGKSSPGKPSAGSPSESPGGESGEELKPSEDQPTDRAAKQLKSASERMQKAQKQLEKAEREGAAEEQQKAVQELEQAKAELERVLRQLREEEMEQTLTMLAARFKKMLEAQIRVQEGTVRLDRIAESNRGHDDEIESARLSREETLIAHEAEKALLLLREEGSSVAFPETVSLMHEDMQQVATRLGDFKVGTGHY